MMRKAIGPKLRFEILKRDKLTCRYCGAKAPDVLIVIDHVVPVAEGGVTEKSNLVAACDGCNSGKGKKLLTRDLECEIKDPHFNYNEYLAPWELEIEEKYISIAKDWILKRLEIFHKNNPDILEEGDLIRFNETSVNILLCCVFNYIESLWNPKTRTLLPRNPTIEPIIHFWQISNKTLSVMLDLNLCNIIEFHNNEPGRIDFSSFLKVLQIPTDLDFAINFDKIIKGMG